MGYVSTGERTGFPLETPRYEGAFVAGLYSEAKTAQSDKKRHAYAAIPTWSTLSVSAGDQRYSPQTPPQEISNFRQTLNVRCGLIRTSLIWTASDGKATDLVYEVVADRANPHVGAVRLRMTPHWGGQAQVADIVDGAGTRRMHITGGKAEGNTTRVGFETEGVVAKGTVVSTLGADERVGRPRARIDGSPPNSRSMYRSTVARPTNSASSLVLTPR